MTSDGTNTYAWDAENRLLSITYSTGATTLFTYDPLGRCVKIEETGSTPTYPGNAIKQFVWCGNERCEERDNSNAVVKQFFSRGQRNGSTNYFYTLDHLGSVREMTNTSATIVYQQSFDPYGKATNIVNTTPADFGYAGMYLHSRSGMNLTLYRAYKPDLGRWISRDPMEEEGGINLYAYVMNNPVGYIDPQGGFLIALAAIPPAAAAAGVAYAGAAVAAAALGEQLGKHLGPALDKGIKEMGRAKDFCLLMNQPDKDKGGEKPRTGKNPVVSGGKPSGGERVTGTSGQITPKGPQGKDIGGGSTVSGGSDHSPVYYPGGKEYPSVPQYTPGTITQPMPKW